jgi:hypothetical protein
MIAQGIALSAKQAFLFGVHQPTDTYKIALYTKRANIGPATAHYTDEGEVSGQGYTRGGITLTGYKVTTVGKNAAITFADVKIDRATFTAHGAMVYNASKNNSVLCTLNFGNERPVYDGAFEIRFPQPNENSALILFA